MLLIPTELRESKIHGVGVFYTGEGAIPANNLIWWFQVGFDQSWTEDQILALPTQAQRHLYYNVWKSRRSGLYLLCADNLKYVNHSYSPNTHFIDGPSKQFEANCYAYTIIEPGQEITQNYQEFDSVGESELWEKIEKRTGIVRAEFDKEVYG